jgi:hypothetical protein
MEDLKKAIQEVKEPEIVKHLKEIRGLQIKKIYRHKDSLLRFADWIAEFFGYKLELIIDEPELVIKETFVLPEKKQKYSVWAKWFKERIEEWKINNPETWEQRKSILNGIT